LLAFERIYSIVNQNNESKIMNEVREFAYSYSTDVELSPFANYLSDHWLPKVQNTGW